MSNDISSYQDITNPQITIGSDVAQTSKYINKVDVAFCTKCQHSFIIKIRWEYIQLFGANKDD